MSKKATYKFPTRITVTVEEPTNDEAYLCVQEEGFRDISTDGQRVAVYQLVTTGIVAIDKSLIEDKPKKRKRGSGRSRTGKRPVK